MSNDIYGTVEKGGTVSCLARVVGEDAAAINQSTIASATYSVFLLDDNDPDLRSAVSGYDAVSLAVSSIIFNSLQTDARWTADEVGYNFRHTIDISTNNAFAIAGRNYLIEYRLTPSSGQVIIVRFRVNCI